MQESLDFVKFSDQLSSSAPTPGGGGASAVVGALACALGQMVCNLTLGKEAYADVADEVDRLLGELEEERYQMIALIDEDEDAFEPLMDAYRVPKDDPQRPEIIQHALLRACEPPLKVMGHAARVIEQLERLAVIGAKGVLSDAGVAVTCARAALEGASLNVYINAASLENAEKAAELSSQADRLLADYAPRAQAVFASVQRELRG